jgi:hypothetical protein
MAVSPSVVAPASQREWAVRRHLLDSGAGSGGDAISRFYAVAADASALTPGAADLSFDPAPVWRRVGQPVLAVWGGADGIVPTRASAEALSAALATGPNMDRSFRTFPGATDNLGVRAEAFRPGSAPGFKELSAAWLGAHLSGNGPHATVATPLPPGDAVPVHRLADPSPLERWPVQLAWLLLPALALAAHLAFELRRRRRLVDEDEAGSFSSDESSAMPGAHTWWWLGGVVLLDVLALGALAYAVGTIVEVDGRNVAAIAGVPLALEVAWLVTVAAAAVTVLLTGRIVMGRAAGIGRRPATTVVVASWAWLLLALYWLV